MAFMSLEILSSTLFSLKSYCEGTELLPHIGGITFVIDWEYEVLRESDVKFTNASAEGLMHRQEFGKAMHAFHASISKQFWRSLQSQSRVALGSLLIQFIRSAIFGQDAFHAGMISSLCCKWIIEVSKHLCLDLLEEQKLIDLLLRNDDSWPLWITPDNSTSERKYSLKAERVLTDVHVSAIFLFFIWSEYYELMVFDFLYY